MAKRDALLVLGETKYENRLKSGAIEKMSQDRLDYERKLHEEHMNSANIVEKALDESGVGYEILRVKGSENGDFENREVVITLGGDGTLLGAASHIYDKTPVIGIRSKSGSRGALCNFEPCEFGKFFQGFVEDGIETEEWTRIEGELDGISDMALNEISVQMNYGRNANYIISTKGPGNARKSERQACTGVVVSTGTGSTGWWKNIKGASCFFPRTSKLAGFVSREHDIDSQYRLGFGFIDEKMSIEIESLESKNLEVTFDSDDRRVYDLPEFETLEIKISKMPLSVVKRPENIV